MTKEEVSKEAETGNHLIDMLEAAIVPAMGPLTMGSVMGYATGYALRVVGKGVALFVGVSFMMVQSAAYTGYINVDWGKASKDIRLALDLDGDGKIDKNDLKIMFKKFVDVCTFNLPSGAGFTLGLMLGMGFTGGTAGKAAAVALTVPRIAALGVGATGGTGVMMTLKEQWEAARGHASALTGRIASKQQAPKLSEEELFALSLKGKALPELREVERGLRGGLSALRGAEKDAAAKRIEAVVEAKKAAKAALKPAK